jgi:hypothetical protein
MDLVGATNGGLGSIRVNGTLKLRNYGVGYIIAKRKYLQH